MNPRILKNLFYTMLRIRLVEERIAQLYPEQEMRCPVHLSIGQEAVAAGVCAALQPDDAVFSSHRSHAHYLAKGCNLKAMMAELYGKSTGCCGGKGGSMHLVDLSAGMFAAVPIVGSTIPIAVGAALGSVMRGEPRVTVAFFGDAATEEGVFHESLNYAALKNLPVLFISENNYYSVYSPLAVRQPERREAMVLAQGHGIESHQRSGNDVMEVYQLASKAVEKARGGGGPTFLEFMTYRWLEHCGPNYDNDLGYRSECEFLEWKGRCPVATFREELKNLKILDGQEAGSMESQIAAEIDEAVEFAKSSPLPERHLLFEHIYAS
jgi:TPP-dependent pyruvate/acetoin dehydrogenase alpha subunit